VLTSACGSAATSTCSPLVGPTGSGWWGIDIDPHSWTVAEDPSHFQPEGASATANVSFLEEHGDPGRDFPGCARLRSEVFSTVVVNLMQPTSWPCLSAGRRLLKPVRVYSPCLRRSARTEALLRDRCSRQCPQRRPLLSDFQHWPPSGLSRSGLVSDRAGDHDPDLTRPAHRPLALFLRHPPPVRHRRLEEACEDTPGRDYQGESPPHPHGFPSTSTTAFERRPGVPGLRATAFGCWPKAARAPLQVSSGRLPSPLTALPRLLVADLPFGPCRWQLCFVP